MCYTSKSHIDKVELSGSPISGATGFDMVGLR